jgi:hypothetical protein
MTAIASTDIGYAFAPRAAKKLEDGRLAIQCTLTFGNGALTYPSGGIPLIKGKLGVANVIDSLTIDDAGGSAYEFKFDKTNLKILMFNGTPANHTHTVAAHDHDLLVKGGQAAAGTAAVAYYATDILGKEAATDKTIVGTASATKGGVIQGASAVSGGSTPGSVAIAELSGTAIAAQTLIVTVVGY